MNLQQYSDQEWQSLHEEIQKRFRALADEVQLAAPSAQPRFGKTVTKRFPLFSHVSFPRITTDGANDIIVGVDVAPVNGQWGIDADICDEEEGTIYFELPNTPFSVATFDELKDRVLQTTEQLIREGKSALLRHFGSPAGVPSSSGAAVPDVARKG